MEVKGVCPLCKNAYEESEHSYSYGMVLCFDCYLNEWIGKYSKITDKPKYDEDEDTEVCYACFEKQCEKCMPIGSIVKSEIQNQMDKVIKLCGYGENPPTCIIELVKLMSMFIYKIEKKHEN